MRDESPRLGFAYTVRTSFQELNGALSVDA